MAPSAAVPSSLVSYVPPDGLTLYHGTSRAAARSILASGFRRAAAPSYTGVATNLSESVAVAYEYGAPEEGGRVLAVRLAPGARCLEEAGPWPFGRGRHYDEAFLAGRADAVRTCGGNVWLLWSHASVLSVRALGAAEARRLLAAEILAAGPDMAYNGAAQAYALAVHGGCRNPSDEEDARVALAALRRAGAVR